MDVSPNYLRRALVMTLPAAALFSVPIGLRLQQFLAPRVGMTMSAPRSVILLGASVLISGILVCSSWATGICLLQLRHQRPGVAMLLIIINLVALSLSLRVASVLFFGSAY